MNSRPSARFTYRYIIDILKDIGTSVAYIYISKENIKTMSCKQGPGFLSGKKGIEAELKEFRAAQSRGLLAIFNDITHVLRHGDITFATIDGFPIIKEIKSSHRAFAHNRSKKQLKAIDEIHSFLNEDRIDKPKLLFNANYKDFSFERIFIKNEVKDHRDILNNLTTRQFCERG